MDNSLETSIRVGAAAARLRIELAPAHTRRASQLTARAARPLADGCASPLESLLSEFEARLTEAAQDLAEASQDADPALTERVIADEVEAYDHWLQELARPRGLGRSERAA